VATFPTSPTPLRPGELPNDAAASSRIRTCAECGRPLSVGERMFYFLDALQAPALCRICLAENERASWQVADVPIGGSVGHFESRPAPRASGRGPADAAADGRFYPFFEEYLEDVDAALDELPRTTPLRAVALRLRGVAIERWESGEFTDGLRVIRRLWRQLGGLHLIPARPAEPTAASDRARAPPEYDESVLDGALDSEDVVDAEDRIAPDGARDRSTGPVAAGTSAALGPGRLPPGLVAAADAVDRSGAPELR